MIGLRVPKGILPMYPVLGWEGFKVFLVSYPFKVDSKSGKGLFTRSKEDTVWSDDDEAF